MERYAMDPHEQDDRDDAPFPGGSTEQRDAWLAEKAGPALGQTSVRSRAFHQAMERAQRELDAPPCGTPVDEAEERAHLAQLVSGQPFATFNILRGYLYAERRHAVGRPLSEAEVARIVAFATDAWAARAAGAAA